MVYPDRFIRRVILTVAIVGAAYIAWEVRAVLMIIFGGMIIATLLNALSNKIGKWIPLKRKITVGIAIFTIALVFVGAGWWIGGNISDQFEEIGDRLPRAINASMEWLSQFPFASSIIDEGKTIEDMEVPWERIAGFTGTALGAIANIVLIFAVGVYLAATPDVYHRGTVSLIPPIYRERADDAFIAAAGGLRQWLIGQMFTMVIVGVLVAIGLKFLDIPLALSLGLIAGLLEFIPFIGPFAFGVLAVLLAFMEGPTQALHVALLCLVIQQLEGNVITPLVQRRTVRLPPVLGLIGVLIFGALFGIFGILLATPLMVVVMILVQKLYIQYGLEAEVTDEPSPSEHANAGID